jgi:hypothetical protein
MSMSASTQIATTAAALAAKPAGAEQTLPSLLSLLVQVLTRRIKAFHASGIRLPLLAEYWEDVLDGAFTELGHPTTWTPDRSHSVGEDMRLPSVPNSRISCKSGQIMPRKRMVKISGSRSTKHDGLNAKIAHFCMDHDDWYLLLAKPKSYKGVYTLMMFPSSLIKPDQLEWTESKSGKQWTGVPKPGNTVPFTAIIGKAMSAQLWVEIPTDHIPYKCEIDCR